jgi:hypothetical protein
MEEPHKLVQWLGDYATDDDKERAIRNRFVHMNDEQRTRELQSMSSWLNDGSSLRQKSQIARLGQDLNRLHVAMRKIGR